MFRQLAHEEWVLPNHYVGADTVKNYIKFQVGLTLHLAIFPFKPKYKDTDVWNLTHCFLCFGNRLMKNEFCQAITVGAHTVKNYIKFQVGLTLYLAIFPLKSKYKDTDFWNLTHCFLIFRKSALEEWVLPSHHVGAHTLNKLYKIPSWTDAPFSNIRIKVLIQRYRCLKLDTLFFNISEIGSWRMSFAKPSRWSSYRKQII